MKEVSWCGDCLGVRESTKVVLPLVPQGPGKCDKCGKRKRVYHKRLAQAHKARGLV